MLQECSFWVSRNGAVQMFFSDTKQRHVCWKIYSKVRNDFGCVAGAYYFQFQVSWGSENESGFLSETVLQNKWSLSIVVVGFETFCQKRWNRKKTSDNVHWNMWINIKKLYAGNNIFNKRILNMRFWIIYTLVQFSFFGVLQFNQCFLKFFVVGQPWWATFLLSLPTIKKLSTALIYWTYYRSLEIMKRCL